MRMIFLNIMKQFPFILNLVKPMPPKLKPRIPLQGVLKNMSIAKFEVALPILDFKAITFYKSYF